MPLNESPSASVSRRGPERLGSDALYTVVWVRGEHDIATREHLAATIAQAAGRTGADIVVDLSGVTFMDASTIGALVDARNHLRASLRSMTVRDPSPRARRVLDLCGLARLIDEHAAPTQPPVSTGSCSWVAAPAWDGGQESTQPPVAQDAISQESAPTARRRTEPAVPIQPRRGSA